MTNEASNTVDESAELLSLARGCDYSATFEWPRREMLCVLPFYSWRVFAAYASPERIQRLLAAHAAELAAEREKVIRECADIAAHAASECHKARNPSGCSACDEVESSILALLPAEVR